MYDALIKQTNAYDIISRDKTAGTLSHAYLFVCADGDYLREYLKVFAKLICCDMDSGYCDECRSCKLIEKESYADATVYPKDGGKTVTEDASEIVEKSYIKPLENKYRVFIISNAENMTATAQNKILKTLEEPPQNVCIIMGVTADYQLLTTVKSRVKRIEIPPFSSSVLHSYFEEKYGKSERLTRAIKESEGKASEVVTLMENESAYDMNKFCKDLLQNMRSSKDVIKYVGKINNENLAIFIKAMQIEVMRILKEMYATGKAEIYGFKVGSAIKIEEMLKEKQRALNYNANVQMTVDSLLLGIVEEKYRWQKL